MNKRISIVLSIILVMLMAIPYSWTVYADDAAQAEPDATSVSDEQEQTVAAEPGPVQSEPASEEASAAEEQAEPDTSSDHVEQEHPDAAEAEADQGNSEPAAIEVPAAEQTEQEGAGAPSGNEHPDIADMQAQASSPQTGKAASEKGITVAGKKLDGNEDGSGKGWTYEKESGRIVLRDFTDKADILSDGTGVDIVTTGFNRIGTLSCDGDINVVGTGILLVDRLELPEGKALNLMPLKEYYGENGGSVAVFLKQNDGSYSLINGSVAGIVDEEIVIPDKTKLVLPYGTSLDLKAVRFRIITDDEGNTTVTDVTDEVLPEGDFGPNIHYYGGGLSVSNLVISEGASVSSHDLGTLLKSGIRVTDSLVNNGIITGGDVVILGDYSGKGIIEKADIELGKGQSSSLSVTDSTIRLSGSYVLDQIISGGDSCIYYGGETEIRRLKISDGDTLRIYSLNDLGRSNVLKLTESIDDGNVYISSGIAELGKDLKLINGGTISTEDPQIVGNIVTGAPIFNYSGIDILLDGKTGPVFLGPDDAVMPGQDSIPVTSFHLSQIRQPEGYYMLEENPLTDDSYEQLTPFDATQSELSGVITYNDLHGKYFPDLTKLPDSMSLVFEVYRCINNKMSMTVLCTKDGGYEAEPAVDSEGVFLIRMGFLNCWTSSHGGGAITSTRADQTGSGDIGGNSNAVFRGTGITRTSGLDDPEKPDPVKPDPDPVKPDPIRPDPDPIRPDPDPIRPDPDPVRPDPEDTVTVNTTARNVISLNIKEQYLNAGDSVLPYYVLSAAANGSELTELKNPVEVIMDYEIPDEFRGKPLYAVFTDPDENSDEILKAFRAEYNEESKKLKFETALLGEFVIAPLDFEGEEFSPEFYDELEKAEAVQPLLELLKEKEKKEGNA